MLTPGKKAKAMMWGAIPLLVLPLVADPGMSGERSQRDDGQQSFSQSQQSFSNQNNNRRSRHSHESQGRQGQNRYDRESQSEREYPQLGSRPGEAGERGDVSIFGSPSTLPPGQHAPQYSGADQQRFQGDDFKKRGDQGRYNQGNRQRSFDQDRHSRNSDQFQSRRGQDRFNQGDRQRSFDRDRHSRYSDQSQGRRGQDRFNQGDRQRSFDRDRRSRYSDEFQSRRGQDRYDRRDRSRQSDRNRPDWYSHDFETPLNEGRFMDPLTAPRYSDYEGRRYERHPRRSYGMDRQKEGEVYDEYQSRRERGGGRYDYRPDPYQP